MKFIQDNTCMKCIRGNCPGSPPWSALGHKRTLGTLIRMSAFLPKPDFVKRPFRPLFVHCAPELKATAFFPHYFGSLLSRPWRCPDGCRYSPTFGGAEDKYSDF